MAPRSEETSLMPSIQEDPTADTELAKPVNCDAAESFFSAPTNFCTDFLGNVFGSKKCNHCEQKLVNSDERLEESEGEKIIYYHSKCKIEREALIEQHKRLMKDLLRFFVIRAELVRRAELASSEAEQTDRALFEAEEPAETKRGIFSKLFSACRNNTAVEV